MNTASAQKDYFEKSLFVTSLCPEFTLVFIWCRLITQKCLSKQTTRWQQPLKCGFGWESDKKCFLALGDVQNEWERLSNDLVTTLPATFHLSYRILWAPPAHAHVCRKKRPTKKIPFKFAPKFMLPCHWPPSTPQNPIQCRVVRQLNAALEHRTRVIALSQKRIATKKKKNQNSFQSIWFIKQFHSDSTDDSV